jgi:hypothetical protein
METEKIEAYCLKDKRKCEILNPVPATFKNGTPILTGVCAVCGNKLFKIVKKVAK